MIWTATPILRPQVKARRTAASKGTITVHDKILVASLAVMEPGSHSNSGSAGNKRMSFVVSAWSPAQRRIKLSASSNTVSVMDFKLELVGVPVSDVDRAKDFYVEQAGFVLDHDHTVADDVRFVQLTPPGSACSIAIGKGLTQLAPGALDNLQVVVGDIHQARAELAGRGVEVSEVDVQPWGSFVFFRDPDGNRWAVQQLPDYS
jgi:catechol 2,3-dioxygenase-like lactoylglutathione lyase family enzyme